MYECNEAKYSLLYMYGTGYPKLVNADSSDTLNKKLNFIKNYSDMKILGKLYNQVIDEINDVESNTDECKKCSELSSDFWADSLRSISEYYTEFSKLYKIMYNGLCNLFKLVLFVNDKKEIKYISDEKEIMKNIIKSYNKKYGSDYLGIGIETLPKMKYDFKKYKMNKNTKVLSLLKKLVVIVNGMRGIINNISYDVNFDFEDIKKCNKHEDDYIDPISYDYKHVLHNVEECRSSCDDMYEELGFIFGCISLLVNVETNPILNSLMDRLIGSIENFDTSKIETLIQNINEKISCVKDEFDYCKKCTKLTDNFWERDLEYVNSDFKELTDLYNAMMYYWNDFKKLIKK